MKTTDYIEVAYDDETRAMACAKVLAGTATMEERAAIVKALDDLHRENTWLDRFLEAMSTAVYEIASTMPAPAEATGRQLPTMVRFWRWGLWEDCMANVPDQTERCLQALCATAFDEGLRLGAAQRAADVLL